MEAVAVSPAQFYSARQRVRSYIGRALLRIRAQSALNSSILVATVSLWTLALLIFLDRLLALSYLGVSIWLIWGGLSALGIPYVLWRMYAPHNHEKLAAVLADERLGLHARLCTALTLDLNDPANALFGEAFFNEALDRLRGLQVDRAFPLTLPRATPFLFLPAAVVAGLHCWMPQQDHLGLKKQDDQKRRTVETRDKAATRLEQRLERLKPQIDESVSDNAAQFKVQNLIEQAKDVAKELKEGKRDPNEALIALGQLKSQIEQEKEKLTQGKEFLDRLQKLKDDQLPLEQSDLPREVSEALKDGDPNLAANKMRQLAEKIKDEILNNPNKSDAEKQQDMEKLRSELEKLASALAEDEALREQLQDAARKLSAEDMQKLQEEVNKFSGQAGKKRMAEMLNELEDAAEELERLDEEDDAKLDEEDEDDWDTLQSAEESLEEAMEGLTAEEGMEQGQQGEGQQAEGQQGKAGQGKKGKQGDRSGRTVKGKGKGKGKKDGSGQNQGGQPGKQGGNGGGNQPGAQQGDKDGGADMATGGGQGSGRRAYRDGDAEFKKEKLSGQLQHGAITGLSHFRGQGATSDAKMTFKQVHDNVERAEASPLELERIPADAKEVVKEYFSKVTEGTGASPKPKAPASFDGTKPELPSAPEKPVRQPLKE